MDQTRADAVRGAMLTNTLVQCATIQLHTPFAQNSASANSRIYDAAHAAVRNVRYVRDVRVLACVNPFMAVSRVDTLPLLVSALSTPSLRSQHARTRQPGVQFSFKC